MEIVAHRGLHTAAPENSLGALRAAVDARIAYIEVDIRASRDGIPYLLHDARLERTTDGRGPLAALDADDVDRLRLRDGSRIPRLRDALDDCLGLATLCLDVKDVRAGHAAIELARGRDRNVEVWSSHEEVVARAADAGVPAVLITLGLMPRSGRRELLDLARQLGAYAISFFPADLESATVEACRTVGMPFMCGTPNDRGTWRLLADAGACAIITDRPIECRDALAATGPLR